MQNSREDVLAQIIVSASVAQGYSAASDFVVQRINDDLDEWDRQLRAVPTEMLADCADGALELLQPGKPLTPSHVRNQYQAFVATQRSVRTLPVSADYVSCWLCNGIGWQIALVFCPTRNNWFEQARGCQCNTAPPAYRREYALEPPGYEKTLTGLWKPAEGRLGLKCGCVFCGQDRQPKQSGQQEQIIQRYQQAKENYGGDSDYNNASDEMPF